MDKKDLYYNDPTPNIDPSTGFVVGSEEYHRTHNLIKEEHLTDLGRGIYYITCDGKEVATMEEVMQYNQMFYDRMKNKIEDHNIKNKIEDHTIKNRGTHR